MIVKEETGKMERLNGFEGERLPCVCGYHGMGSHICGLAYPYLMISDLSDDQIRDCDKLVWYIYDRPAPGIYDMVAKFNATHSALASGQSGLQGISDPA